MASVTVVIGGGDAKSVAKTLAGAGDKVRAAGDAMEELRFDLRALRFAEPPMVCATAAFVRDVQRFGTAGRVTVIRPTRDDVHQYLSRMNFYRAIGATVAEPFSRRPPDGRFIALTRIDAGRQRAVMTQISDCLKRGFGLKDAFRWSTDYILSELVDNFQVHASAELAYIQAQNYPDRLAVSLVDRGIGIPGSMKQRQEYSAMETKEVLKVSIEDGASSLWDSPGRGLFMTAEAIRENSGRLQIVSGDACLTVTARATKVEDVPYWQGTLIAIELSKETDISIWEMFPEINGPDDWGEVWG